MFRRRRRQPDAEAAEETTPAGVEVAAADVDDERPAEPPRPQGPWDVADAPEDAPGTQRLDLGGLRVPVLPGLELRIDMDAAQKPVAATVVAGPSAMQVNAFAAPRTEGIWGEVRAEILASLQAGGAREVEGPFGPEVLSKVPAGPPVPGRGTPVVDARFIGVDGPRWFLRGLVSGPAATDRALAAPFEEVLRGVVVVRGGEAMPPREPLPLVLPRQVQEAAAAHAEQQAQGQPAQAQSSQAQQEAQAQALAQQQAQQRAQQQALAAAQAQLAAQQRSAAAGPDAGGPPRTGTPQADPREDGPGSAASRRVGGADDQAGDGTREAPRSSAPAPKLSMADQLAQAARAVAARQTGATAGAAGGSTTPTPAVGPPAPAGEGSAPAGAPATSSAEAPPPAAEPLVASSDQQHADRPPADRPPADRPPADQQPAAPAVEPPTAGPASSEPDLGVLDAPPAAGGGLDPGGPRP